MPVCHWPHKLEEIDVTITDQYPHKIYNPPFPFTSETASEKLLTAYERVNNKHKDG